MMAVLSAECAARYPAEPTRQQR